MNLDNLHSKLMAAARAARPSDHVPYAFEKRIMARLASVSQIDLLGAWSNALWRAAVSCVVIMLLSGAWSLWAERRHSQANFSQELERAVFASASSTDSMDEAW